MNYEKSVLCFAPNDWWGMNPSCATHYMKRFAADGYKVLFVNPFSSDIAGRKSGFLKRMARKLRSLAKSLRKVSDNLYVYSPVFLPLHGSKALDALNNAFIGLQLKAARALCGIRKPILWMENPRAADFMGAIDNSLVVYHVSDHFAKSRYAKDLAALEAREAAITDNSDLIVCVSRALHDLKKGRPNVRYLPHGVDFEAFRGAAERGETHPALRGAPRPIAGYYGTLSTSNDIELWEHCADRLPGVTFAFAGKVTGGDYSRLFSKPNVRYLGMLPYEEIPALCASFDLCMQQWKMTDWIRACNPLKTHEYFAAGKPVVSVPINQIVEEYSALVSVAEGKEDFAAAIERELAGDSPDRKAERIRIAREHSWLSNYGRMVEWIEAALETKARSGTESEQRP